VNAITSILQSFGQGRIVQPKADDPDFAVIASDVIISVRGGLAVSTEAFVEISLLPYGRHPGLIALSNDKVTLVVPCQDSDNVCVVDLSQRRVTRTIPLSPGSVPWQAAVTPDGKIACVTNSRFKDADDLSPRIPSTLSVIDLQTGAVLADVPVGVGPNGLALDHLGRFAYVANSRSNDVSVVDLRDYRQIRRIAVGQRPFSVALTPDDDRLLVTNCQDASLSIIDTKTFHVLHVVTTGVVGIDHPNPEWGSGDTVGVCAADDRIAYVTNWRSGSVKSVDLAAGRIISELSPIPLPFGLQMTSDGQLLLVASITEFTVIAVARTLLEKKSNLNRSAPARTTDLPSVDLWVADPDSHRVLGYLAEASDSKSDMDGIHSAAAAGADAIALTTL
jgi:YVTN family beta-propeller protein